MSLHAELERLREKVHDQDVEIKRLHLASVRFKEALDAKTAYAESLEAENHRLKTTIEYGIKGA